MAMTGKLLVMTIFVACLSGVWSNYLKFNHKYEDFDDFRLIQKILSKNRIPETRKHPNNVSISLFFFYVLYYVYNNTVHDIYAHW